MIKRFDKDGDGERTRPSATHSATSFEGNLAGVAVTNAVDAVGAPAAVVVDSAAAASPPRNFNSC